MGLNYKWENNWHGREKLLNSKVKNVAVDINKLLVKEMNKMQQTQNRNQNICDI